MTAIHAAIERRPAMWYFGLVFVISWGGILLVVGPGGLRASADEVGRLLPLVFLVNFAGPPIASVLLTATLHGRQGLRNLFARLASWRVGARWYAIALLTAPVLVTVVLLALRLASPDYQLGIVTTSNKVSLLLMGIGWGLVGGGLLEELGWTGFAVPTLRQRYGTLTTGIVVGLLWGLWHLPITYWVMSGTSPGLLTLPDFAIMFVFFHFGALPAYRVLLVWIHDHTASLPMTMLMHASYSASRLILNPAAITGLALATYDLASATALWLIVAALALAVGGRLSRQPLPRRAA